MAAKTTKTVPAANDMATIIAALQAQITALSDKPAAPAAPKKATVAAKAVPAEKVIDFGCLRQTGKTRASNSGKTMLVPVMGKMPDGTVVGGTLWVK